MLRRFLVVALVALTAPASAAASTVLPAGFAETTAWTVPDAPTALRFAPDGHVFVAGKSGVIYEFDGLGDTTPTVVADLSDEVYDGFDRGLLGLAVDPGYPARPYLYVAYSYDRDPVSGSAWNDGCTDDQGAAGTCPVLARISRIDVRTGSETVLLTDFCDQFQSHAIGTVAFGPDGALYAGAGDGASYAGTDTGQPGNPCGDAAGWGGALRAQGYRRGVQSITLDGTLVRLDPNTPTTPSRALIAAYGFRNPFRFAFRPGTSELWVGDVGFNTWEEIDRVPDLSRVRNYGWPCYEGFGVEPDYAALNLASCTSLQDADVEDPVLVYQHGATFTGCGPSWGSAISGLAFYSASAFPAAYHGALFFADFARACIWAMLPGANGAPDPSKVSLFASGAGTPVDLEVGPDGALYYADINDWQIRRITGPPPPATTPPPAATPAPTPTATPTPAPTARIAPLRAPTRLRMDRRGVVTIHLSCPAVACRFTARLAYRGQTLGRAAGSHTLRPRLSQRGRTLVRRRIPLRLTVTRRIGTSTQSAARTLRIRR